MADELTLAVLAGRLRASRERAGFSQRHVEDQTGIHRSAVSDIERGLRKVDSLELRALATLYGEDVTHYLGNTPQVLSRPEQLAQQLEAVTTSLHGYIEQRARELAEPSIALAEETAARDVERARRELQRERDLTAELRLQLESSLQRESALRHARPSAPIPERTPHP